VERRDRRLQIRSDKKLFFDFKKERRLVAFALVASVIAADSIIMLSSTAEEKNFAGNILRPLTAVIAVAFSLKVVYRQRLDGLFGRAYAGLAIGLVLWFAAEITWAYYSLIVQIEVPFPSLADAFWLAGYGPFGYHLFTTARLHRAFSKGSKWTIVITAAVTIVSALYIFQLVLQSEVSKLDSVLPLAISITYPIADAILIIPAVLSISNSGRGELTAVPWIFISWIFTAIADALFGYTAVSNIAGEISIWNLFYNAAYLFMAAGLYWHNKFFLIDECKMERLWLNRNR
jgi:hypothetical protein